MCTVTIIPSGNSFFITHSRDENSTRAKALPPELYQVNDYTLLFPKDVKGGGTWVAVNENGNAGVLLNGGFSRHIPHPPYRKSRGLILLDIVSSPDLWQALQAMPLNNIEPFTTILWNNGVLFETRWDGTKKHTVQLNHFESHIWSSTTLYDPEALLKRKNWFSSWCNLNPRPVMNDIIQFHMEGGEGDPCNDLCMNRDNDCVRTVSISAVELTSRKGLMKYLDMSDNSWHQREITFTKAAVENQ